MFRFNPINKFYFKLQKNRTRENKYFPPRITSSSLSKVLYNKKKVLWLIMDDLDVYERTCLDLIAVIRIYYILPLTAAQKVHRTYFPKPRNKLERY